VAEHDNDHSYPQPACGNHRRSQLSAEEYQKEAIAHAELLCDTLNFIRAQQGADTALLEAVLDGAEVFLGVKDLDMDCAVIRFTNTASGKPRMQSYMWDWLDAHPIEKRAERIATELLELVRSGKLVPASPSRPTKS